MILRRVAVFVVACGCSLTLGDEVELRLGAKAAVEAIHAALIDGRSDQVVAATHPRVVALLGGHARMVSILEASGRDLADGGYHYRSVRVDEPLDIVEQADETYVIVPFTLVIQAPGGKIIVSGFTLGVSLDRGRSWCCVNVDSDLRSLRQVLPNLPERLRLPERRKATYEKD